MWVQFPPGPPIIKVHTMKIKKGSTRCVFLIGKYAIKVPRLNNFIDGLDSNMAEIYAFNEWGKTREDLGCKLCPIVASLGSLAVVMERADPYPSSIVSPEDYSELTSDHKPENYGVINGNTVCVDYA